MRLTSPRDEREAFVAPFQEPSTSELVTKLITQELNQACWNWNYNRVASCCDRGGGEGGKAPGMEWEEVEWVGGGL